MMIWLLVSLAKTVLIDTLQCNQKVGWLDYLERNYGRILE